MKRAATPDAAGLERVARNSHAVTIRIFIVDDHPIVRAGLETALGDFPEFAIVASVGTVAEARQQLGMVTADVVLLDLDLDGDDGASLIPVMLERGLPVIVFSVHASDVRVLAAMHAGARGYLLKGTAVARIADAVRDVHGGRTHLDPRVAGRVVQALRQPARHDNLSVRQDEVLQLVAAGLTNREIAARMSISARTVKFHLEALFDKLGVDNRTQAVATAAARGLLAPPPTM